MVVKKLEKDISVFFSDLGDFVRAYLSYFRDLFVSIFHCFEGIKNFLSGLLYRQRGRFSRPFSHFWMALLLFLGIVSAPTIEELLKGREVEWSNYSPSSALASYSEESLTALTVESSRFTRGEIIGYVVREGDTVSSIAKKFGVSIDTVIWANNIKSVIKIKPGDQLKIPPVTGIVHKVVYGETVYSVAKKYQANPQAVVDFPFNSFANDETFALALGQILIVPDGVMPKAVPVEPKKYLAQQEVKTVVGAGQFIWPTAGTITQRFSWYHQAIDIANKDGPVVVAASGGKIVLVKYGNVGYGNHIVIDHGNGFQTLYGHLARIYIENGQTVSAGQGIGQMGSTGRSTGTHLHFEVNQNGAKLNPLTVLK